MWADRKRHPIKLVVGLGNPGRQYAETRHNVGWWVVDHLADVWHFDGWKRDGDAMVTTGLVAGVKTRLVKPETFMNLSGAVLRPYVRRPFWSAKIDLLVIVDDVAIPTGTYRVRASGSAGGHNGLKSIEGVIGSRDYARLRIGVGPESAETLSGDLADYVLSPVGKRDREAITTLMPTFTQATETWLQHGVERTMNDFNRKG